MGGAPIDVDVILERDLPVRMRDGVILSANLFRPADEGRVPAIMSVTPYGKDRQRDRLITFFMRLTGVRFGNIKVSRFTGFEAPDPLYWVRGGYAVMLADVRGMHKSQGRAGVLTDRDAEDYYDLIEWAASQPWCDGAVGLSGVSYLAMSQWRVAALRPPHLNAIIPSEAVSDLYREMAFHGGIPETGFVPTWWKRRMMAGRNRQFDFAEDFLAALERIDASRYRASRSARERSGVQAQMPTTTTDMSNPPAITPMLFTRLFTRAQRKIKPPGEVEYSGRVPPLPFPFHFRFFPKEDS
jgi:putative CocE/NonD family hydrolase